MPTAGGGAKPEEERGKGSDLLARLCPHQRRCDDHRCALMLPCLLEELAWPEGLEQRGRIWRFVSSVPPMGPSGEAAFPPNP